MNNTNFTIQIKSVNKSIISYTNFVLELLKALQINYSFINLPNKRKKFTVLKSPHVNKKAREQFEIIKYKKIFNLKLATEERFLINKLFLNKPKYIKLIIKKII